VSLAASEAQDQGRRRERETNRRRKHFENGEPRAEEMDGALHGKLDPTTTACLQLIDRGSPRSTRP